MEGCGRGKQGQSSRSQRRCCGADITWCCFDVGHAADARLGAARERQPLSRALPPVAGQRATQEQTCDREKRRPGAALQRRWPKGSRPRCGRRLVLGRARTGQLGALPAAPTVH